MSDVRWEGFTHDEIHARVQQGPGRGASADAEAAWATMETTIRTVDDQLTRAVRQIGVDWQGAAADSVGGGMTVLSNWALDAAGDALLTREGIGAQADAAGHVRTAMPAPRTAEWNEAVGQALSGVGHIASVPDIGALEDRMSEDRAVAVGLMNRYTSDSSTNQQMMNYWTPPPSVVVEAGTPGGTAGAEAGARLGVAGAVAGALAAAGVAAARSGARGAVPGAAGAEGAPVLGSAAGGPGTAPGPAAAAGPPAPGAAVVPGAPAGTGGAASRTGRAPGGAPPGGVRPVVPGPPPRPDVDGGRASTRDGPFGGPPGPPPVPGSSSRTTGGVLGDGPASGGPGGPAYGGVPRAPLGGPAGEGVAARPPEAGAERGGTAGRGTPVSGHGILPMTGAATRPGDQEHRRPNYLVDDTDAFADDRWFTPPVIGGADLEVARG
jgi:hypothetical protein